MTEVMVSQCASTIHTLNRICTGSDFLRITYRNEPLPTIKFSYLLLERFLFFYPILFGWFPLPFLLPKKAYDTLSQKHRDSRKKQVLRMYASEKHTLLKVHPRINNTLRWLVSHLSFRCRLYSLPVHFFSILFFFFDLKRVL